MIIEPKDRGVRSWIWAVPEDEVGKRMEDREGYSLWSTSAKPGETVIIMAPSLLAPNQEEFMRSIEKLNKRGIRVKFGIDPSPEEIQELTSDSKIKKILSMTDQDIEFRPISDLAYHSSLMFGPDTPVSPPPMAFVEGGEKKVFLKEGSDQIDVAHELMHLVMHTEVPTATTGEDPIFHYVVTMNSIILDIEVDRRLEELGIKVDQKRIKETKEEMGQMKRKEYNFARGDSTMLIVYRLLSAPNKKVLKNYRKTVEKHAPEKLHEAEQLAESIKKQDLSSPVGIKKAYEVLLRYYAMEDSVEILAPSSGV